jgi:hypothetical protein
MALRAIHKDRNRGEDVAQRQLSAGEDGAGSERELR